VQLELQVQDHPEVSGAIKTSLPKIKTSLSHRVAFEKGCIEMDIGKFNLN
jgi:hypothetical protein